MQYYKLCRVLFFFYGGGGWNKMDKLLLLEDQEMACILCPVTEFDGQNGIIFLLT